MSRVCGYVRATPVRACVSVAMLPPLAMARAPDGCRGRAAAVRQLGEGAGKDMPRYEYHVNRERLTCDEHERHAQEWGGHVVSIESMEELQHVQSLHEGGIMIGARRIGRGNGARRADGQVENGEAPG